MANRKKKEEALAVVQAQTEGSGQPAVQSGYSAAGLDSRSEVENALAARRQAVRLAALARAVRPPVQPAAARALPPVWAVTPPGM